MAIITSTDITASREIASVDVSASNAVFIGTEELRSNFSSSIAARVGDAGEDNEYSFKTISVSGQSDVVADTTTDTLTLVAGSNMTLTTNAGGDSITFAAAGGGGGGGSGIFAATGSQVATTGNLIITGSNSGLGFPGLHVSQSMSSSINSVLIEGSGSKVLEVKGTQGQLFAVTDELSGSLFSVNTISGTPVIEAFSDNKVTIGSFAQPLMITGSANGGTSISGSNNSTASFGMILVNGTDVSSSLGSGGGGSGAVSAVSNGSNNRIATFTSADALTGEANLHYDGAALVVTGSSSTKGAFTAFMSSNGRALELLGNNRQIDFRIGEGDYAGENAGYGFFWRYRGQNTGNDNDLQLWSEGQDGADVQIYNILQDGSFTLYGGSNTAFVVNSSGEITKIGQDSPSSGQFLKWDGSKVVWDDAGGGGGGGSSIWTTAGNVKYANASLELTGSSTANPALFISASAVPISASTPTLDVHGTGSVLQVKGTQGQLFSVDNKYAYSATGYTSGSWTAETFMTASALLALNDQIGVPVFTFYEDSTLDWPLYGTTDGTNAFIKRNMTMHVSGTTHPTAVYTASQDGDPSLKVSGIGQVLNVISEDSRTGQFSVGSIDRLGVASTEFTASTAMTVTSPYGVPLLSVYNDGTFEMGHLGKETIQREGNISVTQSIYGIGSGAYSLDAQNVATPALKVSATGSLILAQNPSLADIFSVSEDFGIGATSGPEFSGQPTSSLFSAATSFGVSVFEAFDDGTFTVGAVNTNTNTIDREGHAYFSSSYLLHTSKSFADPVLRVHGTGSLVAVGSEFSVNEYLNQKPSSSGQGTQQHDDRSDFFSVGGLAGMGPLRVTARNAVHLGEGIPLTVVGTSAAPQEKNAVTQSGFPSLSPFNTVYSLGPFDNSGWETSTSSSYGTSSAAPEESHAFSGKILKVGTSDVKRGHLYVLRQDGSTAEEGHWYQAIASVAASGSTNLLAVACGTGKSYEVGMLIEGVIRLEDKMMEDDPEIGAEVYVSGTKLGGYDITATSTSAHFVRIIGNVIQKNAQNNTGGHTPYNDCLIYFNPDRTSVTLS